MVDNKLVEVINILLVEDNEGDIRLTKEALKESKVAINLYIVKDGVEAIEFLKKKGKFENEIRPDVVILDLNLPKKDGREVLDEIKQDEGLKSIPIVILTSSEAEIDILKAYNLYANCYIKKPLGLDQFITIVQSIAHFWFGIVKLPKHGCGY